MEGIEVLRVIFLRKQRFGAFFFVDAVRQVFIFGVEPKILLVIPGKGLVLIYFRDFSPKDVYGSLLKSG
jgi:hypothetical protein